VGRRRTTWTWSTHPNLSAPFQPPRNDRRIQETHRRDAPDLRRTPDGDTWSRARWQVDGAYADDLVADALADTLFGEVTWDPTAKTLYQHAEDTIRYRTRHDRHRAKRFRHSRIDAPSCAAEQQATRGFVEASLRLDHNGETAEGAIFATEVLTKVRELAAGDPSILRYLDAIVAGAQTRTEIIEVTKMSLRRFGTHATPRPLVEQLDHKVVASAQPPGARA
jgi:hypothetical protein